MCNLEGQMEKCRRDLALRPDFNMGDCFNMFSNFGRSAHGITSEDVYLCIKNNLEMSVTQDEVFIVFCKVDKDSDGVWSFDEMGE
jgi:Ca2+-binding EF-hand superfamily protein